MAFKLKDFQARHNKSDKTDAFLDALQKYMVDELEQQTTNFASLKNPNQFPIELQPLVESTYGYDTPQITEQTEEDVRRQYKRLFDWVKLKGTTTGLRSFLYSLGFDMETSPMVSNTYQEFRPVNDEEGLAEGGEIFTPHVLIDFSQIESIEDEFIKNDQFSIIRQRMDQIIGAWVVLHWRFNTKGFAEEYSNVLVKDNGVEGVALDDFNVANSAESGYCIKNDSDIELRKTYQYQYTEFTTDVDVGTLDADLDSSITSLDSTLYTEESVDVELRQANGLVKLKADIGVEPDSPYAGEQWNALLFKDDGGQPILAFKYPTAELLAGELVSIRANNIVYKSPPERIPASLNEQEAYGENENVKTWLLSDYDLDFNKANVGDIAVRGDSGFVSDRNFNVPYLTEMKTYKELDRRGYWVVGDLDGTTSGSDPSLSGGDLWNPLMDPCKDYELRFVNGAERIEFTAPLNKVTDIIGETVEQIGLYLNDGTLIAVSEFPDLGITISDYNDRTEYRLRIQLPSNSVVFDG